MTDIDEYEEDDYESDLEKELLVKKILKPCPICKSGNMQAKEMGEGFTRSWVIVCNDCNMVFSYQKVGFIDKNDMIEFWNRKVIE